MSQHAPQTYEYDLNVAAADIDEMGHVNNAVYFTYLEHAYVHYMRELRLAWPNADGVGFIIAHASCDYRAPLYLAEQVTIHARVTHIGRSSLEFDYRLEGGDGRLVANGRTVQVCYDYSQNRPVPILATWREAILDYEPGLHQQVDLSTQETDPWPLHST